MDHDEATTRLLDTAERLFYERGIQTVGMDEVRTASGVSLKRLYQCFPAKEALVVAYLRRRDTRWLSSLANFVAHHDPTDQIPAVFDWLHAWFSEPGFRGCAFINSAGELGATSPEVLAAVRDHKAAVREYLATLADQTNVPDLADHLNLLVEGAITTAAITGDPTTAHQARQAIELLLNRP
ncbi:TetR/AcrR family transcriptional regulator [Actinokineospora sp. NBRC 105648]|uniref:TetR/AcrR family transcriptional regulator n=1 Tax=Actinokineospora sp. NBRC 105648 TaxID=3032206 RepID=UPI0024A5C800|nr:TetR/AcrR family transcriptional regulator [Actinokineospora sp. NBRC 105648]GLZ39356.1 TetR family transcriptional regulator [Actinokineospora sp. NBRC 105648]